MLKRKSVDSGESHAMEFIAKVTTIPVPKVFEARHVQTKWGEEFRIVMEYIPGKPLNIIWKDLSDDQKLNICR